MSEQIYCHPHRWHVQRIGEGPQLLLLHGTGGSTHSFRDLAPVLASDFQVIAVDLPGQGLSQLGARQRSGLVPMADDMAALCRAQGWVPFAVIGHSAGAAVALRMAQYLAPETVIVGINAALGNFKGMAGILFPVMARILAMTPFTSVVFARSIGTSARVRTLLDSTGSRLSDTGVALYRQLLADPNHVDAALLMMAQWSLDGLLQDLGCIHNPVQLIVGERDRAVPPATSDEAARRLPNASVTRFSGLGHLAHEEDPEAIATTILAFLNAVRGVILGR